MRRIFIVIFIVSLTFTMLLSFYSYANTLDNENSYTKFPIVMINEEIVDFNDLLPEIFDGITCVPAILMCENLRLQTFWHYDDKILEITDNDNVLLIDYKNGRVKMSDNEWVDNSYLYIYEDVAFIPLTLLTKQKAYISEFHKEPGNIAVVSIFMNNEAKTDFSQFFEQNKEFFKEYLFEHNKKVEEMILKRNEQYKSSLNVEKIYLKRWEQIGEKLTLTANENLKNEVKVYWSMDADDGTHRWEEAPYNISKPCPFWYSWDEGEHSVSARLDNGITSKVLTTKINVLSPPIKQNNVKSIVVCKELNQLYLFNGENIEKTYPVATGKLSTPTPVGTFKIINKCLNPGGPYGTRWMGLSQPNYGIHGTNAPNSIGQNASKGCVRMYNDDVIDLYSRIDVGTIVKIVN